MKTTNKRRFQRLADHYDRDIARVLSTAFVPPVFCAFAYWLLKKATN